MFMCSLYVCAGIWDNYLHNEWSVIHAECHYNSKLEGTKTYKKKYIISKISIFDIAYITYSGMDYNAYARVLRTTGRNNNYYVLHTQPADTEYFIIYDV